MTFEEEVRALLEANRGQPFEIIERVVAELHRQYGREIPPPIIGTIAPLESLDKFKG